MTTKLKNYFPMIRSREEILKEIDDNIKLTEKFYSWGDSARQEFLDFCTGVRGVKLLYDSFFQRDHESGDSTGKAGRLSECFTAEKSKNRGSVAGGFQPYCG